MRFQHIAPGLMAPSDTMISTMRTLRRISAGLLTFVIVVSGAAPGWAGGTAPPAPAAPSAAPGAAQAPAPEDSEEATPPRVSYIHGEVSLWRPGAQDWTPATDRKSVV